MPDPPIPLLTAKLLGVTRSEKPTRRTQPPVLLVNIGQLLTLSSSKSGPRRGLELREIGLIKDAAVLCLGGKIVSVGKTKDALRDPWLKKNRKRITEIVCAG